MGCADRSCYDLHCHSKATGTKLVAEKKLDAPVEKEFVTLIPKKGVIGKSFRQEAKMVTEALARLTEPEEIKALDAQLKESGFVLSLSLPPAPRALTPEAPPLSSPAPSL